MKTKITAAPLSTEQKPAFEKCLAALEKNIADLLEYDQKLESLPSEIEELRQEKQIKLSQGSKLSRADAMELAAIDFQIGALEADIQSLEDQTEQRNEEALAANSTGLSLLTGLVRESILPEMESIFVSAISVFYGDKNKASEAFQGTQTFVTIQARCCERPNPIFCDCRHLLPASKRRVELIKAALAGQLRFDLQGNFLAE